MNISNYITDKLSAFIEKFDNAKANYHYNSQANIHVIEILPQKVFDSDEFAQWEFEFYKDQLDCFPLDDVGFISAKTAVELDIVDYSIEGSCYLLDEQITTDECYDNHMISSHILQNSSVVPVTVDEKIDVFNFQETASTYKSYLLNVHEVDNIDYNIDSFSLAS